MSVGRYQTQRNCLQNNSCKKFLIFFFRNSQEAMQHIEIKRSKNKRSIQSLIQDSAIDNSFNYEAHQLRKAFNETIISMNVKNADKDREIEKLKITLRQLEENKTKADLKIRNIQTQLNHKNIQINQLTEMYKETKKKLQYLQYKFECLNENRNLLQVDQNSYEVDAQKESLKKKRLKNEIYNQFSQMITKKIEYFTSDIKKVSMSQQVEQKIETFLQQLVYINPYSEFQVSEQIRNEKRHQYQGRIVREGLSKIENQADEWNLFQKSLQKLRTINRQHGTIHTKERKPVGEVRERSLSISRRRRLFH